MLKEQLLSNVKQPRAGGKGDFFCGDGKGRDLKQIENWFPYSPFPLRGLWDQCLLRKGYTEAL